MSYLHPLKIGSVTLPHNILFGPMAGISDLPFRLLCHEQGAAMGVTELISAKAITFRNRNTAAMLETHPDEGPVAVQLFGHEPAVFAEAIRIMCEVGHGDGSFGTRLCRVPKEPSPWPPWPRCLPWPVSIDINMGCPVPKVVSGGDGSALMKNPRLIEEIVRTCVKAAGACTVAPAEVTSADSVSVEAVPAETAPADTVALSGRVPKEPSPWPPWHMPVTVKIRAGFDKQHINAVECALAAEAGGASMVTVHARTRDQMYGGRADWRIIRAVKEAVRIPVTGNGDVTDGADAKRMMDETGCDGVMIARAAQGNPWIFREVTEYLAHGRVTPRPAPEEMLAMVRRHLALLTECKGEYTAVREMRKHIGWYSAGLRGSARFREEVNRTTSREALEALAGQFFDALKTA